MQAKNVLYAAVGAQVVVARKVSDQVSALLRQSQRRDCQLHENGREDHRRLGQ